MKLNGTAILDFPTVGGVMICKRRRAGYFIYYTTVSGFIQVLSPKLPPRRNKQTLEGFCAMLR